MSGKTFSCPSCGAYLEYDPTKRAMTCPYCSTEIQLSDMQPVEAPSETSSVRGYHCTSCGAEVVVGDTTAATRCYYCHNPVVLMDRLSDDFKPDAVIPFRLDRSQAQQHFQKFLASRRFVDRRFFSPEQLQNLSGVYYPYWLGDITGAARTSGEGRQVQVFSTPKHTVTETSIYRIQREGTLTFSNMYRKALGEMDRKLSDGIFPYQEQELTAFEPQYLSGFLAEMRDVPQSDAEADMAAEASQDADAVMRTGLHYNTLNTKTVFQKTQAAMRYALLPAWVLTYRGAQSGTTFYYMLNGQTGSVCGKLPINNRKLTFWSLGIGAAVAGLLLLGGVTLW